MAKDYFSPKRTGETIALTFDFVNVLGSTETISAAAWSVEVVEGTDASPSSMIQGAESISGTKVTQLITGGINKVVYRMVCQADTSIGQEIQGTALLEVNDDC
jgi:hypothetical protein